jgi:hypothetical protein
MNQIYPRLACFDYEPKPTGTIPVSVGFKKNTMKNKLLFSLCLSLLLLNSCTKDTADSIYDAIVLNPRMDDPGPKEEILVLDGETGKTTRRTEIFYGPDGEEMDTIP